MWLFRVALFVEGVLLFLNFDIKSNIVRRIVFISPILLLIVDNSSVGTIAGVAGVAVLLTFL